MFKSHVMGRRLRKENQVRACPGAEGGQDLMKGKSDEQLQAQLRSAPARMQKCGAPGWLSRLGIRLRLRS